VLNARKSAIQLTKRTAAHCRRTYLKGRKECRDVNNAQGSTTPVLAWHPKMSSAVETAIKMTITPSTAAALRMTNVSKNTTPSASNSAYLTSQEELWT
jgi:hypothetical protein